MPDCPGISCGGSSVHQVCRSPRLLACNKAEMSFCNWQGYMYTWDFALAQNCKLVAAVDPVLEEKGYQPIMAGWLPSIAS